MRLQTSLLLAVLAAPFVLPADGFACHRFTKPGGSVRPGLREPSDPPAPPPTSTPSTPGTTPPATPPPATTPGAPGAPPPSSTPTSAPPAPSTGDGPTTDGDKKKKQATDDSTWETWWMLNRIEFFPRRYVTAVVSHEGPVLKGVKPLAAEVVREKFWKQLLTLKDDRQVFVREAALITIGRVASDESLKAEARAILVPTLNDSNRLIARAAALGLFYVADEGCILPMAKIAKDPKAPSDVRAFIALTLTAIGSDIAAPTLMDLVSSDKGADFELVTAALMALGFTPGPESARFLADTFHNKRFRPEWRAEAVESFGRRGSIEESRQILLEALQDREVHIRRSAAMALGVLDYRTPAEKEIAGLVAPYDTTTGAPLPADVQAKVDELQKLVPAQRDTLEKPVREIVKKLTHAMEFDNDNFVCSMAAISLGRIAGQVEERFAIESLLRDIKKERNIVREYQVIALAISKDKAAYDIAVDSIEGKNRQATTSAAGMVSLGILGDERGNAVLRKALEESTHPVLRGYAAFALGMLGQDASSKPILSLLKSTKQPEAMSLAAIGFALLGKKQGSEILLKRLEDTGDPNVTAACVYSLGLMKERSKIPDLVEIAKSNGSFFTQSAAVAALGYVSSAEDFPRRHEMAKGFNYMLNLPLLEFFFYKL